MEPNAVNKAIKRLEGNRIRREIWRRPNLSVRNQTRQQKINANRARLFGNAPQRAANKARREAERNENARRLGYTIVRGSQTTGATGNFFPGARVASEFNMPAAQLQAEHTARTTGEYPIDFSAGGGGEGPPLKRRGGSHKGTTRKGTTRKGTTRKGTTRKGTTRKGTNHMRTRRNRH